MGFHGYHQTNKARFPYENFLRRAAANGFQTIPDRPMGFIGE